MKYLIVSDIHGDEEATQFIANKFVEEKCDLLILLGDILYHGPRNDLPLHYRPKGVIPLLNNLKEKIIAINGNCDAEVDSIVLKFVLNGPYSFEDFNRIFYLTHGQYINPDHPINLPNGSIVLYGHTHIPAITSINNVYYLNPGSISLPKENSPQSYALMDENGIRILDKLGKIINQLKF